MVVQKAFIEILSNLHDDYSLIKKSMKDKRMSQSEKEILKAWDLLKKCKHEEIINAINAITRSNDVIINQCNLILGITYNNQGSFDKSQKLLASTLDHLAEKNLHRHLFIALYNLFIASYNKQDLSFMIFSYNSLRKIKHKAAQEYERLNICAFQLATFENSFDECEILMKKLDSHFNNFSDSMRITYLISKFKFLIKKRELDEASGLLVQLKQFRLFRSSSNYKFMVKLLEFTKNESTFYMYEREFEDCPHLYFQLEVIKSLDQRDQSRAKIFWNKLKEKSSRLYEDEFCYKGDFDLFAFALEKVVYQEKENTIGELPDDKLEALDIILTKNSIINKDELFLILWGRPIESEQDEVSFRNLLYKYRVHRNSNLKFRNSCYYLEKKIG